MRVKLKNEDPIPGYNHIVVTDFKVGDILEVEHTAWGKDDTGKTILAVKLIGYDYYFDMRNFTIVDEKDIEELIKTVVQYNEQV